VLVRRLLGMLVLAAAGWAAAALTGFDPLSASPGFFLVASGLLAVGLFASTAGIPLAELRAHGGVVVRAVTVGVVLKAVLIAAVMLAAFREPGYVLLAVAVAQIDPLSVAALQGSSRLSPRGRTVLLAWSSFDDPVTTVLVVVMAMAVVAFAPGVLSADAMALLPSPQAGVVGNAALLAVAGLAWWLLRRAPGGRDRGAGRPGWTVAAVAVLLGLAVWAVAGFLMLGLAVAGLFFRPRIDALLGRSTDLALAVATVLLGAVLSTGVHLLPGLVLGAAAFGAQVVAAALLTRSLPGDRLRLALSQQSGITAIILALLLEPVLPGAGGVVGPAILVVNALHLVGNGLVDRREAGVARRARRWAVPIPGRGAGPAGVR
jgi:hypothetical protein